MKRGGSAGNGSIAIVQKDKKSFKRQKNSTNVIKLIATKICQHIYIVVVRGKGRTIDYFKLNF